MDDHQQSYRDWIARGLEKPGKRKRRLADALGLDPSAVTRILDGSRQVKLSEVPKVAAYLEEPPPEFEGDFVPDSGGEDRLFMVPVQGYVRAGAEAYYLPLNADELDRVEPVAGANDRTVALEIRGNSMGELLDRWLVFFDDVKSPVTSAQIGRVCIVGLSDGRVLVKKIERQRNGLYRLVSEHGEPITDASVDWAARVKAIVPRS